MVSQQIANLPTLLGVWVRIPVSPPLAFCVGYLINTQHFAALLKLGKVKRTARYAICQYRQYKSDNRSYELSGLYLGW